MGATAGIARMLGWFRQPLHLLLCLFFTLQIGFWHHTRTLLPEMGIVPPVPSERLVEAFSLGDHQFFYRVMALRIQTAGDTFGRFTALYKYDYAELQRWFYLFMHLDNSSDWIPSLASYYYSQTQFRPDVRYIVDYLYDFAADRPEQKWWWLTQAAYLANHRLEDKDLALKMATPLTHARNIPIWAQQMPAFIHEQRGEMEEALAIMEALERDVKDLPPGEQLYIRRFIEERARRLDTLQRQER